MTDYCEDSGAVGQPCNYVESEAVHVVSICELERVVHDILCIRYAGLAVCEKLLVEKRLRYSDAGFGKAFMVAIVWIP